MNKLHVKLSKKFWKIPLYRVVNKSVLTLLLFSVFTVSIRSADAALKLEPVYSKVQTASSPDNSFSTLKNFFLSAQESILISVYQFDSLELAAVLEQILKYKAVKVTLVFEGYPVPKISMQELYIAERLTKLGAKIYFYDAPEGRNSRKFKYTHAKYAVVDSKRVVVGSANYGPGGHPSETSYGNREWEVVLDNVEMAQMFEAAFNHDLAIVGQMAEYGSVDRYTFNPEGFTPKQGNKSGSYSLNLNSVVDQEVYVHPIFAPDNSLYQEDQLKRKEAKLGPILQALDEAVSTVEIEQLNFETYWGNKSYNPNTEPSPLLVQILELARKGLQVRVLLNDDAIFYEKKTAWLSSSFDFFSHLTEFNADFESNDFLAGSSDRDNQSTIAELNRVAKKEGLRLWARKMNFNGCGTRVLHNKGMLLDRNTVLVGSMNWGESSLKFNREAGVLIKSAKVADYYSRAFEYDWNCSKR